MGSEQGQRERDGYRRGDQFGRYIVIDVIGRGAMGVVYSAYDPDLARRVALKVVRPAATRAVGAASVRMRLLREAQAMARLSHPNVVSVFDAGSDRREVFLAMELVVGKNLRRHLSTSLQAVREALAMMLQAGRGLAAAHERGIVHRDFKPENVLVSDDGRVCVTDFGLARPAPSRTESTTTDQPSAAESGVLGVTLTMDGDTIGTPAYMAPEQLEGRPADPRSDQYAFCTALFEVLYGRRPHAGRDAATLRVRKRNVPEIPIQAAPRHVTGLQRGTLGSVPSWLRQLLRRGLDPDPEQRFASMEALLAVIERHLRPRRRRVGGLIGLSLVGAVTVSVGFVHRAWAETPCTEAGEPPSEAFSSAARAEIRAAFADADRPWSQASADHVLEALDAHVSAWSTAHVEVCEATWVRGEQSPSLLDARMGCLRSQWAQLEATTDLLRRADADVIEHAVRIVQGLEAPRNCASLVLRGVDAPPSDPEEAHRWDALRVSLSRNDTLRQAGKSSQAREAVRELLPSVRELGHRSLLAEALLVLGRLEHDEGDLQAAETALREGLTIATGAELESLEAEAWILLSNLAVDQGADFETARFRAQMALSVVDDLGGDPRLESWARTSLGTVAFLTEEDEVALEQWRQALQLRRELLGERHVLVASSLNNLGGALYGMGRLALAEDHLRRAETIRRELLGPEHPDVGESAVNLGLVLIASGRPAEALPSMRSAVRILRAAWGPEHPRVAQAEDGLGQALLEVGAAEKALVHLQRARELYLKAHGPGHPALVHADALIDQARGSLAGGGR